MAWYDILTRNTGWKAVSILLAVLIWYTINQVQTSNDPIRVKAQELKEPKLEPSKPINLLESPAVSTNRINVIQSFDIRILKSPDDHTRYILEPSQVTLELASNADPTPDFANASIVKVLVDPETIPVGVLSTNLNIRWFVHKDVIVKNIEPKDVKVTRVVEESPTPPEDPEPAGEDTDKTEDEDSAE